MPGLMANGYVTKRVKYKLNNQLLRLLWAFMLILKNIEENA